MTTRSPTLTRRSLLAGAAMMATSATAYAVMPRHAEHRLARRKLGTLISKQIGPWQNSSAVGIVVTNSEVDQSDGYDQLLTRVYSAPGLPTIMLLIAYGSTQGGSLQLHRPETCYPGQGFHIGDFEETDFGFRAGSVVQARRFTAWRDSRTERLVYWTRIADSFPLDTAHEYSAIFNSVLRGIVPDGALIRISTIGENIANSDLAITNFARSMIATATPMGRQILIGQT
ncbi:exosortase C-terminal domain/associated protein EpsI [Sphingomonas bacterium]|uniref:exosortase C-terminal domain/associated protein EpsI n=1 Tax=Sphingomonas bacterium TaxID=1895847 RepID=UPI001576D902|nr:exosortase C-terminal domain/associated protein EpsI [Sphingomonas bacterium]